MKSFHERGGKERVGFSSVVRPGKNTKSAPTACSQAGWRGFRGRDEINSRQTVIFMIANLYDTESDRFKLAYRLLYLSLQAVYRLSQSGLFQKYLDYAFLFGKKLLQMLNLRADIHRRITYDSGI